MWNIEPLCQIWVQTFLFVSAMRCSKKRVGCWCWGTCKQQNVNSWKFYLSRKIFYENIICDFCVKFHVCCWCTCHQQNLLDCHLDILLDCKIAWLILILIYSSLVLTCRWRAQWASGRRGCSRQSSPDNNHNLLIINIIIIIWILTIINTLHARLPAYHWRWNFPRSFRILLL